MTRLRLALISSTLFLLVLLAGCGSSNPSPSTSGGQAKNDKGEKASPQATTSKRSKTSSKIAKGSKTTAGAKSTPRPNGKGGTRTLTKKEREQALARLYPTVRKNDKLPKGIYWLGSAAPGQVMFRDNSYTDATVLAYLPGADYKLLRAGKQPKREVVVQTARRKAKEFAALRKALKAQKAKSLQTPIGPALVASNGTAAYIMLESKGLIVLVNGTSAGEVKQALGRLRAR